LFLPHTVNHTTHAPSPLPSPPPLGTSGLSAQSIPFCPPRSYPHTPLPFFPLLLFAEIPPFFAFPSGVMLEFSGELCCLIPPPSHPRRNAFLRGSTYRFLLFMISLCLPCMMNPSLVPFLLFFPGPPFLFPFQWRDSLLPP